MIAIMGVSNSPAMGKEKHKCSNRFLPLQSFVYVSASGNKLGTDNRDHMRHPQ
ncbi:uncharacterized protein Smp_200900 [Schistosoma mansoni]|uniref:uncharacterized protein n=1 Tax=Schistosoma mansoni TaxID=6183 RepID=UPI00022DC68F|nr:uncharacterized protein Smp_200900 [Schistosoma mansoni]|eukprot:XP_018648394.1 uncharacterized protein Smp_200900 [Schistosoma mansoni]